MIQSASEKCTSVENTNTAKKDETTIISKFKCHLESLYIVKTRHKNISASLFPLMKPCMWRPINHTSRGDSQRV